jgi:hypothetical protein
MIFDFSHMISKSIRSISASLYVVAFIAALKLSDRSLLHAEKKSLILFTRQAKTSQDDSTAHKRRNRFHLAIIYHGTHSRAHSLRGCFDAPICPADLDVREHIRGRVLMREVQLSRPPHRLAVTQAGPKFVLGMLEHAVAVLQLSCDGSRKTTPEMLGPVAMLCQRSLRLLSRRGL